MIKSFIFLFLFLASARVFSSNNSVPTELKIITSSSSKQIVTQKLNGKLSKSLVFTQEEMQTLINDLSALYELKGTQVNSPLYKEIFSSNQFDGKMLFAWIFKKIALIAPTRGAKCGNILEANYVGCYSQSENKISLPPSFFNLGRINRLATIIHESRHADGFFHTLGSKTSEDDIIDGSRGAEWSFLRGVSTSCLNCLLMDKLIAYKSAEEVTTKIIKLPSADYATFIQEKKLFKNPLDLKYTALEKSLKLEKSVIHIMPTLCMEKIPFNEFKGNVETTPAEDCILLYYYINSEEARKNPVLLKRSWETRNGFLIVLNPVEKK